MDMLIGGCELESMIRLKKVPEDSGRGPAGATCRPAWEGEPTQVPLPCLLWTQPASRSDS
jgi:hypothetical protein